MSLLRGFVLFLTFGGQIWPKLELVHKPLYFRELSIKFCWFSEMYKFEDFSLGICGDLFNLRYMWRFIIQFYDDTFSKVLRTLSDFKTFLKVCEDIWHFWSFFVSFQVYLRIFLTCVCVCVCVCVRDCFQTFVRTFFMFVKMWTCFFFFYKVFFSEICFWKKYIVSIFLKSLWVIVLKVFSFQYLVLPNIAQQVNIRQEKNSTMYLFSIWLIILILSLSLCLFFIRSLL